VVHLATSTNSSASAQIFNAGTDTFLLVGSLNTARESTAAVVLPNEQTLIVGGNECGPMTYGGTSGFQCNALATAELYNESTKAFTFAGTGGAMSISRSGPSATLITGSGTALDGQVLIVGGSTGSSFLSLTTPPAGSGAPGVETALNTAELYNPATDAFSLTNSIPACPAGHSSPPVAPSTCPAGDVCDCTSGLPSVCGGTANAITSAAESGTTATITMTSANPPGLTIGSNVTVANVNVAGYNGTFVVTAIPSGTTFQYTAAASLGAGTGGTAAADTSECGMVDQGAALIPNDSGKILLAGGDVVAFLGQSSNLSFIFNPATHSFAQTNGSMNIPRELFALVALDPSVVTGALAGDLVAFGGVRANTAACVSPDIVATTLGNAEVYNATAQTWSLDVGASAPITSTSETTNVVTVTSAANPAGLAVGEGVTISGVTVASGVNNYNGTFVVASIPTGTSFTYTAHNSTSSPSTAGSGGTALAGTMGDARAAVATLLTAGGLSGEVVIPGGVDVEAGTFPATCVAVPTLKQRATAEVDLYNPDSGTLGTFSATGSLNQAREGAGQGQIGGASAEVTDLLVIGGACTTATATGPSPSLQSVPIGTAQAATTCGSTNAQNDYSELYSQSAKTWAVGPAPAAGFTPTNAPASVVLP